MTDIRFASIADLDTIVKMSRETFSDTFAKDNTKENMDAYLDKAFDKQVIEKELRDDDCRYFLAIENGTPAGYAKLKMGDERMLDETSLELERIYVVHQFQGKQIGAALLERCLEFAREGRFHWIWLGVWEKNIKAQSFYLKRGFEKFGEQIFELGNDRQTDWLMRKWIGPTNR